MQGDFAFNSHCAQELLVLDGTAIKFTTNQALNTIDVMNDLPVYYNWTSTSRQPTNLANKNGLLILTQQSPFSLYDYIKPK